MSKQVDYRALCLIGGVFFLIVAMALVGIQPPSNQLKLPRVPWIKHRFP